MSVGKIIEKSILNYYCSNFRGLIPHPSTITMLCIMGRVQFDLEEKERCPKTPPLTLTTIIKPPSNKGKEKVKDIEKEERRVENLEQVLVLSNVEMREARQGSASINWMHEPPTEAYNNKKAERSKHQGSSAELIEMMK